MTAAITDADYRAAQIYADFYSELESYSTLAHTAIAKAFAAHRIQARKDAIEEALAACEAVETFDYDTKVSAAGAGAIYSAMEAIRKLKGRTDARTD